MLSCIKSLTSVARLVADVGGVDLPVGLFLEDDAAGAVVVAHGLDLNDGQVGPCGGVG